jgi:nicotinic acid phosphoribosyltransferase
MAFFPETIGLYTDYYEITIAYGYFRKGRQEERAIFDYFFRTNPFQSGFTVFAGLRDLLELLGKFRYSAADTAYLRRLGFADDFLAYLSKKARKMLDEAGHPYVKIVASNQLNEHVIQSLLIEQGAPIDAFGVGTELVSGKPDAALDGVYKLSAINGNPRMKISESVEKVTLPGVKKLLRIFDKDGFFYRDGIFLSDEIPGDIHAFLKQRVTHLPMEHRRFVQPHIYKVGISEKLLKLRSELMDMKRR